MSLELKLAIEGPHADRALEELLAIPGIEGRVATADPHTIHRGEVLVAIGAITAITTGIVTIVDKVLFWRDKWKKDQAAKRLSVFIEDARGNRLALADATPEQLTAALNTLAP